MLTDVFVRSWLESARGAVLELRLALKEATLSRWAIQHDARVWLVNKPHMQAKRHAEQHATTDIYIVADDDCMPLGKDFVATGCATLRDNLAFGLLSAASVIEHHFYTEDTLSPNIVAAHSVGGVAFVRKGILTEFRACPPNQTDDSICSEIVRKGYRTGFMPHVQINHLGYGYSLSSEEHWMA